MVSTGAPLAVRLDPDDPAASALHARVLAGLPRSFRPVPADGRTRTDVVLVSGAGTTWAERAQSAFDGGAKGVMLTAIDAWHPERRWGCSAPPKTGSACAPPETCAALHRIRPPAGVATVIDSPWAAHPAVLDATAPIAADLTAITFITGAFTVPPQAGPSGRLAVEHLALVRVVAAPVVDVRVLAAGDGGYELVGTAGQVPVHLSATVSAAGTERGELCLLGADRQWSLAFGGTALAIPPRVSRAAAGGETVRPAVYECAQRAAWRAMHAAVTAAPVPRYGLACLRADVAALTAAPAATASPPR
jgi:hypothetical protein